MRISSDDWIKFKNKLAAIDKKASDEMAAWLKLKGGYDKIDKDELIAYAYALITKYGEASAALSALIYDEIAASSGTYIPSAEVAETVSYDDIAKAINGVTKKPTTNDGKLYK